MTFDRARIGRTTAHERPGSSLPGLLCVLAIRAERRAGELLAGMELRDFSKRGNQHGGKSHDVTNLDSLGISRMQSSRWQAIARLPEVIAETACFKGLTGSRRQVSV